MSCKSIKQGRALLRVSFVFVCLTSTEENHHLENEEKLFTLFYVVSIPAHDYFVVRRKAFLTSKFLYFSPFFFSTCRSLFFFCFFTLKIKQFRLRNSFQKRKRTKECWQAQKDFMKELVGIQPALFYL